MIRRPPRSTPLYSSAASDVYKRQAVVNYPVMHLNVNPDNFQLKAELVNNAIGDKAYLRTPSVSPWRTIMVSDDARDIVSSKMILNLNEPNKIEDVSWIKPMKYVGIWWEMHVGISTLSLIHISEPTRLRRISYAVFCLKKK